MNQPSDPVESTDNTFDASLITRPADSLLVYYFLVSLLGLVFFPLIFIPLFVRFKTLRYRFDDEGVSMCWGFFFRQEVYLTYRRLQDIHVTRNILERWMGLAKVPIQTASGTSGPTMRIEGIREPKSLRDFLYAQMRGAKEVEEDSESTRDGDAIRVLEEIRDELRKLRASKGESS